MKILHTADWHLGKRLDDRSRLEEQQVVLQEICEIAEREGADAVLVAGDLFDTFNPPTEAVDLLYSTLKRLTADGHRPVIAIAGNHDSPDRIEAPDPLARACGIIFAGYPTPSYPPLHSIPDSGCCRVIMVLWSYSFPDRRYRYGYSSLRMPTNTALKLFSA